MTKMNDENPIIGVDVKLSTFLEVIHQFSISVANAKTSEEVYWILAKELVPSLDLLDCVIYKVNNQTKTLEQVAAFGEKNERNYVIKNRLVLNFGQGHAGLVAETGIPMLIEDCSASKDYVVDVIPAGSEIDVPIKVGNQVLAVISSEHPTKNFYSSFHVKLFEVIASIAVGVLIRIEEKEELESVKKKLESIVEQKSSDLDRVIETISDQYSELKLQNNKQEALLQEVHHRVNNNLQVISSLLNLYISAADQKEAETLQQILNRVQSMALIHQNIYKSFEMNLVDLHAYIRDLLNHLKNVTNKVYLTFDVSVSFQHIGLTTLVPLGLLITELVSDWLEGYESHKVEHVHLIVQLDKSENGKYYRVSLSDNLNNDFTSIRNYKNEGKITHILISALMEQLDGEMTLGFTENNVLRLDFNAAV